MHISKYQFLSILLLFSFFSCKTVHKSHPVLITTGHNDTVQITPSTPSPVEKVKSINVEKLINKITDAQLQYKTLEVPKVNITFNSSSNSYSFKGSIRLAQDSILQISLSKLGISVAKLELTPDSVFFVNYFEKNYFKGSYSDLNKLVHSELSFPLVQSILTNSLPKYGSAETKDYHNFHCSVTDSSEYVLSSFRPGKIEKILKNEKRYQRFINRNNDSTLISQTFHINAQNFKIEDVNLKDLNSHQEANITFSKFQNIQEGILFPTVINFKTVSLSSSSTVLFEFNRFEIDKAINFNFNIPASYRRIERFN